MISLEHRSIAQQVMTGSLSEMPDEIGNQKAYTYGTIASALSHLTLPKVSELLDGHTVRSVSGIMSVLEEDLTERCYGLLEERPELKERLNAATNQRIFTVHGSPSIKDRGFRSLHAGISTAVDMESTTLATIQRRIIHGETITLEGIHKSQRIPFALAMRALATLNVSSPDMFEYVSLPDAVGYGSETVHKVFRSDVTAMSSELGLTLTAELPREVRRSPYANEPTIGCPATLVKHFVHDLHVVAADACMQAGIIPVSDSEL